MLKIQKTLNYFLTNRNSPIFRLLADYKSRVGLSREEMEGVQLSKLNHLLKSAYDHVPYYRKMFEERGLCSRGKVELGYLEEITSLPFLTKEVIRAEGDRLNSDLHAQRQSYKNTSGGSTGEPVVFLQDKAYHDAGGSNDLLIYGWRGADPFDSMIKLWGAERDTYIGKKPFSTMLKDFLRNRMTLNSFNMDEDSMRYFIDMLNRHTPKLIVAYAQSIYELACFAEAQGLRVGSQDAIHTAAGTLYDFMREKIEQVFRCKVFNHYGSREVYGIASECEAHDGLHVLMENNIVEVVDGSGKRCLSGKEGEIVVTNLNNYSMPLVRYRIGDIGVEQNYSQCSCGCNYVKLSKVVGRTVDVFKTKSGGRIDGEYFTHLFYFHDFIHKFRVIQKDYELIEVELVKKGEVPEGVLEAINHKIRIVMGEECQIEYKFPDEIRANLTGKYRYTVSEVE